MKTSSTWRKQSAPALSVPTPPNDEKIVAGYSDEMLKLAIGELFTKGDRRGPWENDRLAFLNAEHKRRTAPKVEKKPNPTA